MVSDSLSFSVYGATRGIVGSRDGREVAKSRHYRDKPHIYGKNVISARRRGGQDYSGWLKSLIRSRN